MRTFDLAPLYRSTVGFDRLFSMLDGFEAAPGYPPYNIEQLGQDGFRITLAVAGFAEADLSLTIEDRQLIIRGRQSEAAEDRVFLHRGIAARAFQRSFVLAEGIEVEGAALENGLLHVDLRRITPQSVVRTIPISRT